MPDRTTKRINIGRYRCLLQGPPDEDIQPNVVWFSYSQVRSFAG